jgi:HEAT repeat protein
MGGKYEEVEVVVENEMPLKIGEEHILFLNHDDRNIVPTYPRTDGNFNIVEHWIGNFKVEGNTIKWLAPPDAQTFRKFETGTAEDFIAQILAEVSASPVQKADELVQQLRELPTPLPGLAPGNGQIPPIEQRRHQLYRDIGQLGADAVPALQRGLRDNDVQIRRNVALIFMQLVSGYWVDEVRQKLDIRNSLPTLLTALDDSDSNVRTWSAQAIGGIGPDAANAVPALIRLLKNNDEGSRNSACIALRGIGPAAKEALPALDDALSDSSENVRRFARRAIESIQGH